MSNKIEQRIAALQKCMEQKNIHAYIIPTTDPHLSEYPASHWASREWISGFTGSAGTVVVTRNKAALWTDSRYFLQGADELKGTSFILQKDGLPLTPSIDEWLIEELGNNDTVGIDGSVYAAKEAASLTYKLNAKNIHLSADYDLIADVWHDRPAIPQNQIFAFPEKYSGESTSDKVARICASLDKNNAQGLLVASLDTIAWIFNIRGNDVKCNPVAVAYGYVSKDETVLFIDPKKLSAETAAYLKEQGVTIADYTKIYDYVAKISTPICLDSNKVSFKLHNTISKQTRIIDIPSPADLMKSIKNATEIEGFKTAMERDGAALVKFLMWLEKAVPKGDVSEMDVAKKIFELRSEQHNFVGESFDTISGYGPNGAIVHYHVSAESSLTIKPEGLLLVDSGGQYFDGTTDITRTIAVGALTHQMKADYTMVLKGHINIATAIYPQGTRGSQLDILARKALWDNGLNFLHGTGHGIGHFLNVHEGPQSIRMNENPTTLQIGMVTSNEPGLYRANQYGIRIENLILTQLETQTEFGDFYSFETLTLCPIDTKPIAKELLTDKEIAWFNTYHRYVYDRLSPVLSDDEKEWLKEKTHEI